MNQTSIAALHDPFKNLRNTEKQRVKGLFNVKVFKDKSAVMKMNHEIMHVGYIVSGKIDLSIILETEEKKKMGSLKQGDYFGLVTVLDHDLSIFDGICDGDVISRTVKKEEFKDITSRHKEVKLYFQQMVISNLARFYLPQGDLKDSLGNNKRNETKRYPARIKTSLDYIHSNFTQALSLETVAGLHGMSKFYFSRLFKQHTGSSFTDYINKIRLTEAKKLLIEEGMNISEACYAVGYNDASYFSRIFKKYEAISPSEYKKILKFESNFTVSQR